MTARNAIAALLFGVLIAWAFDLRAQTPGQPDAPPASDGSHTAWSRAAENRDVSNDDATVLILAQAAVAEATWREADHRGCLHVIRKRAEQAGVSLQEMAIKYVAAFDARTKPTARLRWVLQLRLDARKPPAWPTHLSWSAHAGRWVSVIDLARRFVADPMSVPDPCGDANHWGGRMDKPRGRMVRASCSEATANTFLRVRRR